MHLRNQKKLCAISVWNHVRLGKSFDIQGSFELNCCDNKSRCCDFKILLVLLKTGVSGHFGKSHQ